jgi:hypothetical protein
MKRKLLLVTLAIMLAVPVLAAPQRDAENCLECQEFVITWLEECLRGGDPIPYCVESFNELWGVCNDWFCDPV